MRLRKGSNRFTKLRGPAGRRRRRRRSAGASRPSARPARPPRTRRAAGPRWRRQMNPKLRRKFCEVLVVDGQHARNLIDLVYRSLSKKTKCYISVLFLYISIFSLFVFDMFAFCCSLLNFFLFFRAHVLEGKSGKKTKRKNLPNGRLKMTIGPLRPIRK